MIDESHFIQHSGVPAIHDGTITAVEVRAAEVRVVIQPESAWSAKRISIVFYGVERVLANRPEGMLLYGLSDWIDLRLCCGLCSPTGMTMTIRNLTRRVGSTVPALELRSLNFNIREEPIAPPGG